MQRGSSNKGFSPKPSQNKAYANILSLLRLESTLPHTYKLFMYALNILYAFTTPPQSLTLTTGQMRTVWSNGEQQLLLMMFREEKTPLL